MNGGLNISTTEEGVVNKDSKKVGQKSEDRDKTFLSDVAPPSAVPHGKLVACLEPYHPFLLFSSTATVEENSKNGW